MRREGSGRSMFQRVTIPSVGVRGLSVEVRRSLRPELVPSIRSPRVRLGLKRMRGAEFRDKDDAVCGPTRSNRGVPHCWFVDGKRRIVDAMGAG
jgi:hypothetical protein